MSEKGQTYFKNLEANATKLFVLVCLIILGHYVLKIQYLTFTCSKSTVETLEKGVQYVQSLKTSVVF